MEPSPVTTVLLIGRPGSGKGTQAKLLAEKLGWSILSSGKIFRELREKDGPFGEKIRETYDSGELFPAWFPAYLFQDALLHKNVTEGVIGEGFGRALEEARLEDELLTWLGRKYIVVNLSVSDEEAIRRQLHRNKQEIRPDSDTEEKIRTRLAEYAEHSHPAIEFFKGKGVFIEVNGEDTPENIAVDLYDKIKESL